MKNANVIISGCLFLAAFLVCGCKGDKPNGGVVTTLAGNAKVRGAADGQGATASFSGPTGITVDSSGNLYVCDSVNNKIRKISSDGQVTTLAGSGKEGSAEGNGAASSFNGPMAIAVDGHGIVYVADTLNDLIRKITPEGVVTTLAGVLKWSTLKTTDGKGTEASFDSPTGITVGPQGDLYVAEGGDGLIRKVTPEGLVTTLAGPKSVLLGVEVKYEVPFKDPHGIAFDRSGNLYVADMSSQVIWKMTANGVATVLAGSGKNGSADGNGTEASFNYPCDLSVDYAGNVYVAENLGLKIRKITQDGVVTTLAGSGKVGSADGIGAEASFQMLGGITVDSDGILYVTDTFNNNIRKIQ